MAAIEPPASCKVYTPPNLAKAMVNAIRSNGTQKWLEPSVGRGVFLSALRDRHVPPRRIVAIDLDSSPSENDKLATVHRGVDFLKWSISHRCEFDCIVGNPPFVPIRSLPSPLRKTATLVTDHFGAPIGVSANTWYAFVLRSIDLLRQGGCLAFVLPSSCEYANYCRPGRDAIIASFDRVDLIRSRRPLFENVQEGAAILVCTRKGALGHVFRRHEVDDLEEVIKRLGQLSTYRARRCPKGNVRQAGSEVLLRTVADVGLGGVMGDARYFAFNESRRKQLGIPLRAVRPVVTKARQIRAPQLDQRAFQQLRDTDERVWLFDPPASLLSHQAVRAYLDLSVEDGGCHRDRYKIRNRDPWHKTRLPRRPDAFVSGMSTSGVWLCFNESPRLSATNTLYVVRFRSHEERSRRYEWALALLTSRVHRQLLRSVRVYADGLTKLEPGQLADIRVPIPSRIPNARRRYQDAVRSLLEGDESSCAALADVAVFGTPVRAN